MTPLQIQQLRDVGQNLRKLANSNGPDRQKLHAIADECEALAKGAERREIGNGFDRKG